MASDGFANPGPAWQGVAVDEDGNRVGRARKQPARLTDEEAPALRRAPAKIPCKASSVPGQPKARGRPRKSEEEKRATYEEKKCRQAVARATETSARLSTVALYTKGYAGTICPSLLFPANEEPSQDLSDKRFADGRQRHAAVRALQTSAMSATTRRIKLVSAAPSWRVSFNPDKLVDTNDAGATYDQRSENGSEQTSFYTLQDAFNGSLSQKPSCHSIPVWCPHANCNWEDKSSSEASITREGVSSCADQFGGGKLHVS